MCCRFVLRGDQRRPAARLLGLRRGHHVLARRSIAGADQYEQHAVRDFDAVTRHSQHCLLVAVGGSLVKSDPDRDGARLHRAPR